MSEIGEMWDMDDVPGLLDEIGQKIQLMEGLEDTIKLRYYADAIITLAECIKECVEDEE